jgi:adenylate kinase family enzyme
MIDGAAGTELKIYFAAAVRSGDGDALARRIELLERIGTVTTRHMASPSTIDLGHRDDAAIYAHDQRLLERSHVLVADFALPSTGAGFMVARAVQLDKPALCLYPAGARPSAMLAGCAEITTAFYDHPRDVSARVRAFLLAHAERLAGVTSRAPRLYLAGPPGVGKGTLGARLAAMLGVVHVSTGALLRELLVAGVHPHAPQITGYVNAGALVPAELMAELVVDRLRTPDCQRLGFLLDGYPPSPEDLGNLRAAKISPDLVLYLSCSDETAIARQLTRAARITDTADHARRRIDAFHTAGASYEALAERWYPDHVVARLDGERRPDEVLADALACVDNLLGDPRRDRSYAPLPAFRSNEVKTTRRHFHIDAGWGTTFGAASALRAIVTRVYARAKRAQGQIKLYPIAELAIGPQASAPIYARLPNFHPIASSTSEAFVTGRLGDGDDELMKIVLEEAHAHGAAMAELEDYVGEWTLCADGTLREDARYEELPYDAEQYAAFAAYAAPEVPTWELHLGFDLPKTTGEIPLPLADVLAGCAERGLDNGGWFLFHSPRWACRSNEFSSLSEQDALARLHSQAHAVSAMLGERGHPCDVTFSLERVRGIWTMQA